MSPFKNTPQNLPPIGDQGAKYKHQLAKEMGISLRTLQRMMKEKGIAVPRGYLSPEQQAQIREALGW